MTRVNEEIDRGTRKRAKLQGGDQITYVVRRGDGDITSRVALVEDVGGLDDLDMLHYLDATQRALNKVLAFFLPPAVEKALYETIRTTLFLRQTRQRSIVGNEEDRCNLLKRRLQSVTAEAQVAAAPVKRKRQGTLRFG